MSTPDRDRTHADAKMHTLVEAMGYNKSLQQEVGQVLLDLIDDTECEGRPTPCQPLSTIAPYSHPKDRDIPSDERRRHLDKAERWDSPGAERPSSISSSRIVL